MGRTNHIPAAQITNHLNDLSRDVAHVFTYEMNFPPLINAN